MIILAYSAALAASLMLAKRLVGLMVDRVVGSSEPTRLGTWRGEAGFGLIGTLAIFAAIQADIRASFLVLPAVIGAVSLIVTYDAVLRPVLLARGNRRMSAAPAGLQEWVTSTFGREYKILVFDGPLVNALATGLLPFSHRIILGRTVCESLTGEQLRGIVAHEIGHLQNRHMVILYFANLIYVGALATTLFAVMQIESVRGILEPLAVGLSIAVVTLVFHVGISQRLVGFRLEYSADIFATKMVGLDTYLAALGELDRITDGRVSKGGPSHPTLAERKGHLARRLGAV